MGGGVDCRAVWCTGSSAVAASTRLGSAKSSMSGMSSPVARSSTTLSRASLISVTASLPRLMALKSSGAVPASVSAASASALMAGTTRGGESGPRCWAAGLLGGCGRTVPGDEELLVCREVWLLPVPCPRGPRPRRALEHQIISGRDKLHARAHAGEPCGSWRARAAFTSSGVSRPDSANFDSRKRGTSFSPTLSRKLCMPSGMGPVRRFPMRAALHCDGADPCQ